MKWVHTRSRSQWVYPSGVNRAPSINHYPEGGRLGTAGVDREQKDDPGVGKAIDLQFSSRLLSHCPTLTIHTHIMLFLALTCKMIEIILSK